MHLLATPAIIAVGVELFAWPAAQGHTVKMYSLTCGSITSNRTQTMAAWAVEYRQFFSCLTVVDCSRHVVSTTSTVTLIHEVSDNGEAHLTLDSDVGDPVSRRACHLNRDSAINGQFSLDVALGVRRKLVGVRYQTV